MSVVVLFLTEIPCIPGLQSMRNDVTIHRGILLYLRQNRLYLCTAQSNFCTGLQSFKRISYISFLGISFKFPWLCTSMSLRTSFSTISVSTPHTSVFPQIPTNTTKRPRRIYPRFHSSIPINISGISGLIQVNSSKFYA